MRELLRLHLSSAGYNVEVAEDAIAAGYSSSRTFDLIICDVAMPHMDGFELVAALRADSAVPKKPPVIFLTAETEADDRARGSAASSWRSRSGSRSC